jgi:deoxyribonuclease V
VDVDYRATGAVAAGLWFRGWSAESAVCQAVACFQAVAEYEPGAFYRRELPCLLGVLALGLRPDAVVVDGYVWLGGGKPGLGAHLHAAIRGVVVGVAKTRYSPATDAIPICRGKSQSPLFVSAAGMSAREAANHLMRMHGPCRVPALLKQVDALARSHDNQRCVTVREKQAGECRIVMEPCCFRSKS